MSGYTPLFSSLTTGTLCGKWPDIGLWPIILSMSDKNGVVDVTTQYISSVTGLPHEEVIGCMQRFCEADKYSRSDAEKGARLLLLEPHRPWGWQIVNHSKYREKARKQASDASRVASGAEAERKRLSRAVPRCPALSDAIPPSDSDANTDSNKEEEGRRPDIDPAKQAIERIQKIYPKRKGSHRWSDALSAYRERLREGHEHVEIMTGVQRYAEYVRWKGDEGTEFVQQAATFLGKNKGFTEEWPLHDPKPKGNGFSNQQTAPRARPFGT